MKNNTWPIVVSFGGGTNSAAMLIEMARRKVRPDLVMFADTGGELPETIQFVAEFSAWLEAHDMPPVVTVRSSGKTLENDCLDRSTLPSIAFGFKTCSQRWKVQPQDKYLNNWQPAIESWKAGGKVIKLIGYDANERHRIKDYDSKKFMVSYPLVEWGWTRKQCSDTVKTEGFNPAKSACFFCPSSKRHEVLKLSKSHPDLYARAIKMESDAQLDVIKGLGRNWRWQDLVNADASQMKLFDEMPDEMPCGCYDGGSQDSETVCALPKPDNQPKPSLTQVEFVQ